MPVASLKPVSAMSPIERNKAAAKAAAEIEGAPTVEEAQSLFKALPVELRNDRVVKALAAAIDKAPGGDHETPESEPKPEAAAAPKAAPRPSAITPNAPKVAGAMVSSSDAVEATINSAGENYGLIGVEALDEIDEDSDLPPGVGDVKEIDGQPIVFWQLSKADFHRHKRKPFCVPILRNNPHFAHLPDSSFDVFNHLTNGDLIVCYTSAKMARAYHNKKRSSVDMRNKFLYDSDIKGRESAVAGGQQIKGSYVQGVTVDGESDNVFDRATGRSARR